MLEAARRAVELETDGSLPGYAFANVALGHCLYIAGELDAATVALTKAAYSDAVLLISKVFAFSLLAMVHREQGNSDLSRQYARNALTIVEQGSLSSMPQASLAYTVWGESQATAGDLAGGMATLEEGLVLRRKIPGLSPWPNIHHLLAMGRVATATGELGRAEQLLAEAGHLMSRFPQGMEVMRARLMAARAQLRRREHADHDPDPLTARECDVLRLLPSSMNLTEIATDLYLSRNTVKTHAQAVYRKLGARSRAEAVNIARHRALI